MQLIKTALGQSAFKERSPLFSARQRSVFILFDGKKSVDQVLAATSGMGTSQADIEHMLAQGFLALVGPEAEASQPAVLEAASPGDISVAESSGRTPQERYALAKPIATKLTADLGLFGFRLNLAVEAAAGYEDLLALLPKIQEAVGTKACRELESVLKA